MNPCRNCGEPAVKTSRKGRPRVFCSVECKEAFHAERGKRSRDARLVGRLCVVCGGVIRSRSGRAKACSTACSNKQVNLRKAAARRGQWEATEPTCRECGTSVASKRVNTVFCSPRCKSKNHARTWRERSPHYMREYLYGISRVEYEALLASQDEACAICRVGDPGGKGSWHVDHCHETNKVRGLLCHHCNLMLGNARDEPARLRAAAEYLERST